METQRRWKLDSDCIEVSTAKFASWNGAAPRGRSRGLRGAKRRQFIQRRALPHHGEVGALRSPALSDISSDDHSTGTRGRAAPARRHRPAVFGERIALKALLALSFEANLPSASATPPPSPARPSPAACATNLGAL